MNNINDKIITGIEKICQINKTLLWNINKKYKLSPIQMQIIEYINKYKKTTVSDLSKQFILKKSTISDSVKILIKKGFLQKEENTLDMRSYFLILTEKSKNLIQEINNKNNQFIDFFNNFSEQEKIIIHKFFISLVNHFYNIGIIESIKICFTCSNFIKNHNSDTENKYFCKYLNKEIEIANLNYNCEAFSK